MKPEKPTSLRRRKLLYGASALVFASCAFAWLAVMLRPAIGWLDFRELGVLIFCASAGYFALTGLASRMSLERSYWKLFGLLGVVASLGGFCFMALASAFGFWNEKEVEPLVWVFHLFAGGFAYVSLVMYPRLNLRLRWLQWVSATSVVIPILFFVLVAATGEAWVPHFSVYLVGSLASLGSVGTLAVAFLSWNGNPWHSRTPLKRPEAIDLYCPRCGVREEIPLGAASCSACGLLLRVETDGWDD